MTPLLALSVAYQISKTQMQALHKGPPSSAASAVVLDARMKERADRRLKARSMTGATDGFFLGALQKGGERADNKLGVYLSAYSMGNDAFLDKTLDNIVASKGNMLVFEVKSDYVYFQNDSALATKYGLNKVVFDLPAVIAKAKAKGIYTVARYVSLNDPNFSKAEPEAQIIDPKTGKSIGNTWTQGNRPVVLEYNGQLIDTLLAADIDEINLDYIRFSTEGPSLRASLTAKQRADTIEPFIEMIRAKINAKNPRTKLGLSTYAILGWDYDVNVATLGQDVVRFAPLVDIISPMAYPATFTDPAYYNPAKNPRSRMYYLVNHTLVGYQKRLGEEESKKLRPWIQGYYVTPKDVRDQIDAVYDAGLCGYQVWNANNNYGPTYPAMQGMPEVPERCK